MQLEGEQDLELEGGEEGEKETTKVKTCCAMCLLPTMTVIITYCRHGLKRKRRKEGRKTEVKQVSEEASIFQASFPRKALKSVLSVLSKRGSSTDYRNWEPSPSILIFLKSSSGFFQGHISFKDRRRVGANEVEMA